MNNTLEPPKYCQYTTSKCDQVFYSEEKGTVLFLYPNEPQIIADTIDATKKKLNRQQSNIIGKSWKDLEVQGQIIFCEICKAIRASELIVADITTLNFNLLFEIGFAIGLEKPVLPIRDTNYDVDKKEFEEIGILDTLGYYSFSNSQELVNEITATFPRKKLPVVNEKISHESPLYYMKGTINSDAAITLNATLKKSPLQYRTYDPIETVRLSLFEGRKQVAKSIGVFSHLLSHTRKGFRTHNALCAFISGIAMAQQKVITMIQEEYIQQPIDYRDIVVSYSSTEGIKRILERPIYLIIQNMQKSIHSISNPQENLIQKVDIGDSAAENEIMGLHEYFVRTGQFNQAKQGHSRLVVGRKGSGKTAIFYEVIESIGISKYKLVLDLKPEGHQFTRLKEAILSRMSEGLREHTVMAFWNYILLIELAHKIVLLEYSFAERDNVRFEKYNRIKDLFEDDIPNELTDFSQRLLLKIEKLFNSVKSVDLENANLNITQLLYSGDIQQLNNIICDYLQEKTEVWLLFDNIDKGWPVRGASEEDVLIVRGLLDASRKLQRQLEKRGVNFKCLVFIRTDIYELLLRNTPDKGKDSVIHLDWDDAEVFKTIITNRIKNSVDVEGNFRQIWQTLFTSQIKTEDSFNYIIERTLMRPRDLLNFIQKSIQIALNRNHDNVMSGDILQAEKSFSEDMFIMTGYEIEDTHPEMKDLLYAFQGVSRELNYDDVIKILINANFSAETHENIIEILLWFGFLGVLNIKNHVEKYSFLINYNLRQFYKMIERNEGVFVIHPAFKAALEIE